MRRTWALACLALFIGSMLAPVPGATDITTFSGGESSLDITLSLPELKQVAELEVPNPCIPLRASLNVSADPAHAPLGPTVDVGDDGTVEWAFNGTGYGAFGNQNVLSDGRTGFSTSFDGDFEYHPGLSLPKGASIRSATLELAGTPGDPASASKSGGPIDLKAGEGVAADGPSVPEQSLGVNATVRFSEGMTSAKDAECTAWSNFKIFGWQGSQYQSLAQTFTPSADCNLTGVELQINMIVGSPGPIYVELRSTDGSGKPATALSPVMSIAQGAVTAPGWNSLSFSPPIDLRASTKYAIVAYAKDASTTGTNEYLWYGSALDDPYSGGSLWIYAPDADASGTPAESSLMDQAFRTHVNRRLVDSEMDNVLVDGAPPTSNDGMGRYFYNITDPVYSAGAWSFTVKNQNAFNITSLVYHSSTWYQTQVHGLSVGVNDGIADWTQAGPLNGDVTVDFAAGLARELAKAASTLDDFGNPMSAVNLTIQATGAGGLIMSNLSIRYDCSLAVQDFAGALDGYLAGKPAIIVRVPVAVRAGSAGTVRLGALAVSVDAAPVLLAPIPSTFSIPEDGLNESLIDLSGYLVDDSGCTYRCLPAENVNSSYVELSINGSVLGARALRANWFGTVQLVVEAEDERGQRTGSNSFDITVTAQNDAPVITSTPPTRAEVGKEYLYQVTAGDAENDPLTFALEGAPANMTVNASGGVSWQPGMEELGKTYNITVTVSDGKLSASQRFELVPYITNLPPVILAPGNATARAGTPFSMLIAASDPDGDELVFTLEEAPTGMFVNRTGAVSWNNPQAGNYTIKVRVSDGLATVEASFTLRVAPAPVPIITSAPPKSASQGKRLSYQLTADTSGVANPSYSLVDGPAGMSVSNTGLVTWTPTSRQSGTFHVIVRVRAGTENATQEFDLKVAAAPVVQKTDNTLLILVVIVIVVVLVAVVGAWALKGKGKDERSG